MRQLNVKSLDVSERVTLFQDILDDMQSHAEGIQGGYMLAGDVGVGKTSFVQDLAKVTGLELIIIETPHIVEEHIIDIPFIVVKPNGEVKKGTTNIDQKDAGTRAYDVEFAQSHLYKLLKQARSANDATLLATVQKRGDLAKVWQELGGNERTIPTAIQQARSDHRVILFLDEFFRQASMSIRNMLRSILNGRLGVHTLPRDVYVIYASNLKDDGIGEILSNEDFKQISFDTPSADSWFTYIVNKYKNHPEVKLDEELVHDLYQLMTKAGVNVAHEDSDADIRISPRRWEQLLIYISTGLAHIKNQHDADLLLKNLSVSLKHYSSGTKIDAYDKIMAMVKNIIKERFGFTGSDEGVADHDWRETLQHQIEMRMKAGTARRYVPVIAGPPGAGKTMHVNQLAANLELVPIIIDVQNLTPEEAIGIPIAEKRNDDLEVSFSLPPLLKTVNYQMKEGEAALRDGLIKVHGDVEGKKRFKKWQSANVKYLIFFDELNRTNTKVFNAIRKVLLEKEFNHEHKLPEESVMVAAINPDASGTVGLTKHVRDVFDIIPVGLSWSKFTQFLDGKDFRVDSPVAQISRMAVEAFAEHFKVPEAQADKRYDRQFFVNAGASSVYISGREYTSMVSNIAKGVQRVYTREMALMADPDHDVENAEYRVREEIYRRAEQVLRHIVENKHQAVVPGFWSDLKEWFLYSEKINMTGMFKTKVATLKSLPQMLDRLSDPNVDLYNDTEFTSYLASVDAIEFAEQFADYLVKEVESDIEGFFKTFHNKRKTISNGKIQTEKAEVLKIEHIVNEVLNAVKLHDIDNRLAEQVEKSTRKALVVLVDLEVSNEQIETVVAVSQRLLAYTQKLFGKKKK